MAKITRIRAKDEPRKAEVEKPTKVKKLVAVEEPKKAKESKKTFVLFRPFVAFFRYLKNAFKEIRQVRWPSRKATWKMVLAVLIYTALFVVVISLLDLFFTWLFNLILGN